MLTYFNWPLIGTSFYVLRLGLGVSCYYSFYFSLLFLLDDWPLLDFSFFKDSPLFTTSKSIGAAGVTSGFGVGAGVGVGIGVGSTFGFSFLRD